MSCIHYKFKSCIDYKTLSFDGLHISVRDLKKEIFEKEKIDQNSIDLQLSNGQTKRLYNEETELIPRNSSVDVAKIPALTAKRLPKIQNRDTEGVVTKANKVTPYNRGMNLLTEQMNQKDMPEEDRVKHVMEVSTNAYDPSRYVHRNALMTGVPPPTYVCNKCNKSGHWFKNCPLMSVRRTTGIPREELMQTTADDPQAMLTASGQYVVPIMHKTARLIGKKERPPFYEGEDEVPQPVVETPKVPVPKELTCGICSDLLREAVLIPCCGRSFCDECVRNKLVESDEKRCPACGESGVSPDNLVPNSNVRQAVNNFKNEIGYSHVRGGQQRSAFSGLKISLTGGSSQASVTLPSVLQQTLSKFLPPSYPATAIPQQVVAPTTTSSQLTSQQQGPPATVQTSQVTEPGMERVPSLPVIAQPPVSRSDLPHSTSYPSLQAATEPPGTQPPTVPPPHIVRPQIPTSAAQTNSPSSHGTALQPPGVTAPVAPMPPSMSVPPPAGRMPVVATVAPMVQAPPTNMPHAPPPPIPPMMPNTRFLPPISFIPNQPPGMFRPPTAMTSQPPPPGLFDPTTRPPGVGPPGDPRRSFGDSMTMAWDEFLARKDRKRTAKRRSESVSSTSSYTASRSRSRSRTRTPPVRSPHSRGRKHRRQRSYSRSPSPRRSRRRRTRSPRTPSPTHFVDTNNFFRPGRGHRSGPSSRSHRNEDWFFYAGATRHPPEFLSSAGHNRGNRGPPMSHQGPPRGPPGHSSSYSHGNHHHHHSQQQHQLQPEPLSVFSQGDAGDYRSDRYHQEIPGESSRYHSHSKEHFDEKESDWQPSNAVIELTQQPSGRYPEDEPSEMRHESHPEKHSRVTHTAHRDSKEKKEKVDPNSDLGEKKKKKKKLKSVSGTEEKPKAKEGVEGSPRKKSKPVVEKKRKPSQASIDETQNISDQFSPPKENAPIVDEKKFQPVSAEKLEAPAKIEGRKESDSVRKSNSSSPRKSTSKPDKDRSKDKTKSRRDSAKEESAPVTEAKLIPAEKEKKEMIFPEETTVFSTQAKSKRKEHEPPTTKEHKKERAKDISKSSSDRSHERRPDKDSHKNYDSKTTEYDRSRSNRSKEKPRDDEPHAKRPREHYEVTNQQSSSNVRSVFDLRPVSKPADREAPVEPTSSKTSRSPSRNQKSSHSTSRPSKRSHDQAAKTKEEDRPEAKRERRFKESSDTVETPKDDLKEEKNTRNRDEKKIGGTRRKSLDDSRKDDAATRTDKDSSKAKDSLKSKTDPSPMAVKRNGSSEGQSDPQKSEETKLQTTSVPPKPEPVPEPVRNTKFIDSFQPSKPTEIVFPSEPASLTSPADFMKSQEAVKDTAGKEPTPEGHKSKKEKKKKKKKSKDKSKEESGKKSIESDDAEHKKHKKKRKKSKDEDEESEKPSKSSTKLPLAKPELTSDSIEKSAQIAKPSSAQSKGGLRMEVKSPKFVHSKWEMSSDEDDETFMNVPVRGRNVETTSSRSSTSQRKLSPSIIARAEYALSGKTRLPPAARLGAKKKGSVVVTAGKSARRVSLEEDDTTRRVFSSSGGSNPGSLSITVSDPRHSSEDDIKEFFGKREKINLKPVKLKKSWKNN